MTSDDKKFLIILCVIMVSCLIVGSHGIINRKRIQKRLHNESDFYMSVNFLLGGILIIPCVLLSAFYFWQETKGSVPFNKGTFYWIIVIWGGIAELAIGVHGLINRKKINNPGFDRFSEASVITFFMIIIALIGWVWLWGWPWSPHVLFEWQKTVPR